MQIGKLKSENVDMLEKFDEFGFSNKTKMLDFALDLLRKKIVKSKRRKLKQQLIETYANEIDKDLWVAIETEDFGDIDE